jgi:hypothetical protein
MVLGAVGAWAAPDAPAPQQEVAVIVVNAGVDPAKPVQRVRVSMAYLDGSTLITVSGATRYDATNSEGRAMLLVALEAAQRGGLRVNIDGASNLVIYDPADGQLTGVPSNMTIKLLPKGSPALLGPAQFTAMLNRALLQEKQLNRENQQLKKELAASQSHKQDDLTDAITEWANTNGFPYDQVNDKIEQWANEVLQDKGVIEKKKRAMAELALRNYKLAAELFDESADDIGESMDQEQQKLLENSRKQLRQFIDAEFQSANTNQLYLNYRKATQVLEKTRDRAAALHGLFPEDAALRSMWMEARERAADARVMEGSEAKEGSLLLTHAVDEYQALLAEYNLPAERESWAKTENNLGFALADRGERSSQTEVTKLFAQAVDAFQSALTVQNKAEQPQDWARTENNLGKAKWFQGERISGEQATHLFSDAAHALRAALEVQNKADHTQDWAATENNLGEVLRDQAERSSGAQAIELFVQSAQAHRAALGVQTKVEMPQTWAMTENKLGYALMDQAQWSNGARAAELLVQARQAFQAALEVGTSTSTSQDWAMSQNNWGSALRMQSELTGRAEAMTLLAQSVQAYQAALEIYTRDGFPQAWAWTQTNLGIALTEQGERSSGAEATDLLAQAVQAFRGALTIYPRTELPHAWAIAQHYLGIALMDQGERSSGSEAADLFAQATHAYQAALEVQTRTDLPLYWATIENALGKALADQGDASGASGALEASLELFPDNTRLLERAASTYHNKLYRYGRAHELTARWLKQDDTSQARLRMAEEELTAGHFAECEKRLAAINDADFPASAESATLTGGVLKLACQWGAGEKAAAQETGKKLLAKAAGLKDPEWECAGTVHYLASSSAFGAGRASWIALFESLEKGEGAAMAGSLTELEEVMRH